MCDSKPSRREHPFTPCWILLLCAAVTMISACGNDDSGPTPLPTRTFLFALRGDIDGSQNFIASTSLAPVISQALAELARPLAERTLHINGIIDRGNNGNLGWGWHFVPDQWGLTQISIEVCDGTPDFVERDLDYWVDQMGQFCPWSSYVLAEVIQ